MASQEFHLSAQHDQQSAIDLLEQHTPLSRSELKQAMEKGAVWLQQGKRFTPLRRGKKKLLQDQQLHFYYNPDVLKKLPLQAQMLEQNSDYSVWLKPSGMRSHGSRWSDHCSLERCAEKQLERECYIVHRLDQAASGVILLAHNKKAAAQLSRLFALREIKKTYRIVVAGDFPEQTLHCDLALDDKIAGSHFSKLKTLSDHRSLLSVEIDSGRKHQVRRHALELGYPIIGDRLYGQTGPNSPDLQLCAYQLSFTWQEQDQHYQVPDLSIFLQL